MLLSCPRGMFWLYLAGWTPKSSNVLRNTKHQITELLRAQELAPRVPAGMLAKAATGLP